MFDLIIRNTQRMFIVISRKVLVPHIRPPIRKIVSALGCDIQDEIHLKNQLRRQWQITRDPALKAKVNRWLNHWSATH